MVLDPRLRKRADTVVVRAQLSKTLTNAELFTADSRGDRVLIEVSGDLRSSTMTTRLVSHDGPAAAWPFTFLLTVTIVGTGTFVYVRTRRSRLDLHPDEYAKLAQLAADEESYPDAIQRVEAAHKRSPTSRRLALDHAFYVAKGGDAKKALEILNDRLLAEDPDAHVFAAMLLAEMNQSEAAAERLRSALAISATSLFYIEAEPAFHHILREPELRRAIENARRTLT